MPDAPEPPATKVPAPLGRVLVDPVSAARMQRVWCQIEKARHGRSVWGGPVRWAFISGLITAAVVLAGFVAPFLVAERTSPGPLLTEQGTAVPTVRVAAHASAVTVRLADESTIVVAPGGVLEPLASSASAFIVRLAAGKATFHVQPGGPRRWVVEAGLASIEVVGTRFQVDRRASSVGVRVERGAVLVRAPSLEDGVVKLSAGGRIDVAADDADRDSTARLAPSPEPNDDAASSPSAKRVAEERGAPQATTGSSNDWRQEAANARYVEAYRRLGRQGIRRETQRSRAEDALMTLSDIARKSGHPADAIEPLERVLELHPDSSRAPLAALTLGRVELELARPGRAARALRRALSLGLPEALREDAYVRLIQALVQSGQSRKARLAADEYDRLFRNPRRRAEVQRWLER